MPHPSVIGSGDGQRIPTVEFGRAREDWTFETARGRCDSESRVDLSVGVREEAGSDRIFAQATQATTREGAQPQAPEVTYTKPHQHFDPKKH